MRRRGERRGERSGGRWRERRGVRGRAKGSPFKSIWIQLKSHSRSEREREERERERRRRIQAILGSLTQLSDRNFLSLSSFPTGREVWIFQIGLLWREMFWSSYLLFSLYFLSFFSLSLSSSLSLTKIRKLFSCWSEPEREKEREREREEEEKGGKWIQEKNEDSMFTSYSDPLNVWNFKPFQCPKDSQGFQWKTKETCEEIETFEKFSVKGFCSVMKGRPLLMMGDSLMYYSFLTLVNAMANKKSYTLDKDGVADYYTKLKPQEFIKYPPRTEFYRFDKACESVNEEPFTIFMDNNAYLDLAPTTLEWLKNNSNTIMFINRGFHYQKSSIEYEKYFQEIITKYLQALSTPKSPNPYSSPSSSPHGYLIFRSIHMPHPFCSKFDNSYPFNLKNYSDYEHSQQVQEHLHASYHWYEILVQNENLVQPILNRLISYNIYEAEKRLFFLDIFSSSKLIARRHTSDCLHYCVPGPMDSWLIFLYNMIRTLNKVDENS